MAVTTGQPTRRLKIAYLFSRYPVPSQTFCDTEIRALEAAGHEIEIYACSAPVTSFRHGREDWPRAEILYAPPAAILEAWEFAARADGTWPGDMVADHAARFGPRYDPARRARHALYFADRLRRRGVEHLHVHFANRATHAALFVHALTGVPFSFTAHAQDFLVDLGSDELLRLMCDRAAFVVAVSEWSRRALVERCPSAEGKIHRVYNGLSLDRWPLPPSPPPVPHPEAGLKIFGVGRLIEFKGFQDLIAACHLLRERGVRFSCEIAGEGPSREDLERQASGFDAPHGPIRFCGLLSQAEVRARLAACDVFALPCRVDDKGACDVLPTVILEAMATAKPVVSTHLAAVPEMVESGRTGLLVPPGDPTALAEALERLAGADPAELRRMGDAGRRKLEAEFSAGDSARQLTARFTAARTAANFIPSLVNVGQAQPPLVCLFDCWPLEPSANGTGNLHPENLADLSVRRPGTRFVALQPGAASNFSPLDCVASEVLRAFEFLPDDVVFETVWRLEETLAHRLEGARAGVGGACETADFLLAARRALYLRSVLSPTGKTALSLHAVGPHSLLCAYLLRVLDVVAAPTFLLPAGPEGGVDMAGSTLRKLAAHFGSGWVAGERKLAASLGPTFRGDPFSGPAWLDALRS